MFRLFGATKKVVGSSVSHNAISSGKRNPEEQYIAFLASPEATGIRDEVKRLESLHDVPSCVYPSSTDTRLEGAILQLIETEGSMNLELPARLLALVMQRLGLACANFEEKILVDFLRECIPRLHALVLANPLGNGVAMVELGLEEHLLVILQFLRSRLMSRTTLGIVTSLDTPSPAPPLPTDISSSTPFIAAADLSSSTPYMEGEEANIQTGSSNSVQRSDEGNDAVDKGSGLDSSAALRSSTMVRGEMIDILSSTLQLLLTIHFGTTETQTLAAATAVGMTLPQRISSAETAMTATMMSVVANSIGDFSATRQAIVAECGHLFLYSSKGAPDLNLLVEEEQQQQQQQPVIVAEVLRSLALLILSLCEEPYEQVVHVSLAGIGVQLARFLAAQEGEEMDLLLQQLSCSLLLVTKLLKESPFLTIQAMSSVYFFDNLVCALQVVGAHYEWAPHDDSYAMAREEYIRELQSVTDVENFGVRGLSERVLLLQLPRPRFDRLADNYNADEFMHSYIALLEAQRQARTTAEVRHDPAVLRQLAEVELIIMKALLDAPSRLAPASCIYDTLMRYVIASLPLNDVSALEKQRISVVKPLVNAGLYRILFREPAFSAFRRDPRLQYAAVYLVHYMLTRPSVSLEDATMYGVEDEVGVILDVLLTTDVNKVPSSDEGPEMAPLLCSVLLSALYGPNTTAVAAAVVKNNGIVLLATIAKKCSIASCERSEAWDIGKWVIYLLTQLFRRPEVQQNVLLSDPGIVLSLLTVKGIRKNVEQILISLFSHSCSMVEYQPRMSLLVKCTWEHLGQCAQLETGGSIDAREEDELFLSILYCIRTSINALRTDSLGWGPVRRLQNVLCGGESSTPDAFLCLLHRASLPWRGVRVIYGLSCILHTLATLIQGNPALRSRLFQTIGPEQLVECFNRAWFASHGESWCHFVHHILCLVYEDDKWTEEDGHHIKKRRPISVLPTEDMEGAVIQNPQLLLPLLGMFTKVVEFKVRHRDALEYLLARVSGTVKTSRVTLWMVANAGLFESLTALIPVVTGTALLEMVLTLMMNIASHQISVRETKQFLISIAHAKNEEERQRLVPIVIEVLNIASYAFLNKTTEQQNYIAFRKLSGPTGIRALLPEFPPDGYTICMWVRLEYHKDIHNPQCLFSLYGMEKRTILELAVTMRGLSVIFYDTQKKKVELDLGCNITPHTWTHLSAVHRQATFPFSGSEFVLFLNGAEVINVSRVQYPVLHRAFFFVGTRGEDVEQRSSLSSFTGQMSAVCFFNRSLPTREVVDLFVGATCVANLKHVIVYVDPRFSERGQLHNLAALLRGKPLECPLITYEGTLACNSNSIIDSICLLGALQTVVVPLLVLLVNPQLPFHCRPPTMRHKIVPDEIRKAVDDLLKLVESLLLSNIVRADVLEVGLFPMISHVLQQLVGYHCPNLPQRLCNLCIALLPEGSIFDAAYASLFLSSDFLHSCAEETQLALIKTQHALCRVNVEACRRVRGLDLPYFIASEVAQEYNSTSPHHQAMRAEMFNLMETIMMDPVTTNNADAIIRLVSAVLEQKEFPVLLVEILERIRLLVASRNTLLAAYMGKKNFAAVLIPFLNDTRTEVRNECFLFFCLLVSRSRRTQELLNPTLLTAHEAVHVPCDVSLSWMKDKLQTALVDIALYDTFLAALTGRFDVSLRQRFELRGEDRISFPPALTPMLQLLKRCQEKAMKDRAMLDLATLVQQDPTAWKGIVSVPGWYASIADLYLSEEELHDEHVDGESSFLTATAIVFSGVIFQTFLQEAYGVSELDLLVAYLVQYRAHILLNAILLGVVREYLFFLANRRDSVNGSHFGLGSQLAASNFTAFLCAIEEVLFYSATTYQMYGVGRKLEHNWKRGYVEEKELVVLTKRLKLQEVEVVEEEEGQHPQEHEKKQQHQDENICGVATSFFSGDTTMLRTAPDGVWLHATLALRTMNLITTSAQLLNSGGMGGSVGGNNISGAIGVGGSGVGLSGGGSASGVGGGGSDGSGSVLDGHLRGHYRLRRGGFLRLFVRLFRVICSFTLRDATQIDEILFLATRWVQLVENEQSSFLLLRRQITEQKEHSPLSCSLIMILALHELLTRRLRFSVHGPSVRYKDANHEILDRIKCLCILHKKALSQMQVFRAESSFDLNLSSIRKSTLDWLCCRTQENSIKEFAEVASRQGYDVFIFHCTLTMEKDQVTEKGMARCIEQEHNQTVEQLHQIITDLNVSRKTLLDALEEHLHLIVSEVEGMDTSTERYAPFAARTLATVGFNSVWTRFLDRCKGTIWDLDPAGQHSIKYVRLLEVEHQQLVRRKLQFDPNGTDHANITAMGLSISQLQQFGKQQLRMSGGEDVLLSKDSQHEDENEDDFGTLTSPATVQEIKSTVRFSMPCEVPYMMHCWTATLMIREGEFCVFFDEVNKAYNQRIAGEAESLLIKPRNIIYPSGHAAILVPGRRFRMRRTALEIWFCDGRSVLLNFSTVADMRSAVNSIRTAAERHKVPYLPFCVFHENPKKESLLWRRMEQWRDREISNFEYLLWLNLFGGRTLNDLTQYPVFPWVIADYTSDQLNLENVSTFRDFTLPVGICGGSGCRSRVEMRYEETKQVGDVPAHYFTHYSSPAVVLYYMIRVEPFTTLQIILQGGHFDHADRMFHSMASCWSGVTSNSQDVRELIPELYYFPELCVNNNNVQFGRKQGGLPMDSLELPPWAHGNPYEFVYCMREALESDHVSSMLHHWIDLIFGYKQRGKEAIAALNVFNWHSYEELDKNRGDDVDHQLLIDSLDNIGQTPIQLFTRSHVERRPQDIADPVACSLSVKTVDLRHVCTRVARLAVLDSDRILVICGSGAALLFRLTVFPVVKVTNPPSVSDAGTTPVVAGAVTEPSVPTAKGVSFSQLGRNISSGGGNGSIALGNASANGGGIAAGGRGRPSVDIIDEFERRTAPLPPGVVPSTSNKHGGPCETENVVVLSLDNEVFVAFGGLFDNTFVIRPLWSSSAVGEERLSAHRGRVICIAASDDSQYLVSGAEDTTFIVWSCHLQHGRVKLHVELLFTVYGHEDNPTAVDINPTLDLVATASRGGVLMLHSVTSSRFERSLRHPEKFSIDRVLIQSSCYMPNILYASMADHVIHQVSTNGVTLRSVVAPGRITSWCTTPRQYILVTIAPLTNSNASDDCSGTLLFLHSFRLTVLKSVSCPLPSVGRALSCCAAHPSNPQVIICGSNDGSLSLVRLEQQQ